MKKAWVRLKYQLAQRHLVERGAAAFERAILAKSHAAIDEWQTQMQLKPMALGQLHLYSEGLSHDQQALTGVNMLSSVAAGIEASIQQSGDPAIAIIPEGPYVVPRYPATADADSVARYPNDRGDR